MQARDVYLKKYGIVKSDLPALTGDIPALTSMRFFAALYVSLFHVHFFSGYSFGVFDPIFSAGYLAVDFFFVLSGFILAYTYVDAFKEKSVSMRVFMIKRLARIYPVHVVMLLITAFFLWICKSAGWEAMEDSLNIVNLIYNFMLIHAWNQIDVLTYNQPSWSISAEFFSYLCFPAIIWLVGRWRKTPFTILAYSLVFFILVQVIFLCFGVILSKSSCDYGIIRIVPEFILGVSIYLFFLQYRYERDIRMAILSVFSVIMALLYIGGFDIIVVLFLGVAIYLLAEAQRSGVTMWLSNPIWVYLGKISYSFYMVHYCVILCVIYMLFGKYLGVLGGGVPLGVIQVSCLFVSVMACFPAAMLLYHGVEVPMRRLIIQRFCK